MGKGLAVGLAGLVVVGVAAGGIWYAAADDEVKETGTCAGATYALSVEAEEQDRVEVGFELTSGSAGEDWQVSLRRNDEVLIEGTRTTDDDAEIELEAYAVDDDAVFRVDFSPADGSETCTVEADTP